MDDERTTEQLMQTLADDCDRCHEELLGALDEYDPNTEVEGEHSYEFHARQLIRAIFAHIEAVTFSVKASSAARCMEKGIEISPQERYFAIDQEYGLNEKGQVVPKAAKIPLANNVRFALDLHRRACEVEEPFDASVDWWSSFKKAIKVRDRLAHPKFPDDLDVSGDDIIAALDARQGFEFELLFYGRGEVPPEIKL